MKKNIFLYFRKVGIKVDLINHHFKLESVHSGLYFVQDENNFIIQLLQVGSGSGFNEKSTESRSLKTTHICLHHEVDICSRKEPATLD